MTKNQLQAAFLLKQAKAHELAALGEQMRLDLNPPDRVMCQHRHDEHARTAVLFRKAAAVLVKGH